MTEAVLQTVHAILHHDSNMDAYNQQADACIWRFHVDNPDNIAAYDRLLDDVMKLPAHQFIAEELDILKAHIPPEPVPPPA